MVPLDHGASTTRGPGHRQNPAGGVEHERILFHREGGM